MQQHEKFMRRCLDLARLGAGHVKSNPMVGSVIVHRGKIIGQGYHKVFGGPHAEINALDSVAESDRHLIPESTLYISLEPCCIHGKTPPCTSRILKEGIPHVVISCLDPNPAVSGNGVAQLSEAGVKVESGILESEGRFLIRIFTHWMAQKRPFITLKWAQSADGFIGRKNHQIWLSGETTKYFVHKLRSEHSGIMVGTQTVLVDEPLLNNRLHPGPSPIRIIPDRQGTIPPAHPMFSDGIQTIMYTETEGNQSNDHVTCVQMKFDGNSLDAILADLGSRQIETVLVEGGAELINSFIEQNAWHEAYLIKSPKTLDEGIKAPVAEGELIHKFHIEDDEIFHFQNKALKFF